MHFIRLITILFLLNSTIILPVSAGDIIYEPDEEAQAEKSIRILDEVVDKNEYEKSTVQPCYKQLSSPVKIMPLGDSITYDNCSLDVPNPRPVGVRHAYRNYLWYMLRDARYYANFVGSRHAGQSIVPSFDIDNDGYPGIKSGELGQYVFTLLEQSRPNIILLHIGTNDHSTSVTGLNYLLNEVDRYERHYQRHVKVILAAVIDSTQQERHNWVTGYNVNLRHLAQTRKSQGDDIILVDMYRGAGINYATDMQDFLHPNNSGYYKMAGVWFNALRTVLPTPIPTEPTEVTTTILTYNSATLAWKDTSNNELGFKIYRNGILLATLPANTTQYGLTDLEPRTTYIYNIVAYNNTGESAPVTIRFTTKDDYAWLIAVNHMLL